MDDPLIVQSIAIFLRSIPMYMCMNEPFWQVSLIMDFLRKENNANIILLTCNCLRALIAKNAKVKVKYYFSHI